MKITVAIPTYGRDAVLTSSISDLLALDPPPWELLIVDQTPRHDPQTEERLRRWHEQGLIRWLRLERPSITGAMNRALQEAKGDRVLFLDDDIRPDPDLLRFHQVAAEADPELMVAGRVLQPWHQGLADPEGAPFLFNSTEARAVEAFMGGNVAIPRAAALALGGFDANFVKVAYHFEAEFAYRWCRSGARIHYEPRALIHHLRAERGGTRSYGRHLTTLQPDHAVGRYYYLLRTEPLPVALAASAAALLRSVCTRHHLRRPWWIPATLLAELRGWLWALSLHRRGPALLGSRARRLLIVASRPTPQLASIFRALACHPDLALEVLYLAIPDPEAAGIGSIPPRGAEIPLLEGYRWRLPHGGRGAGGRGADRSLWLWNPLAALSGGDRRERPDAIVLCGSPRPALAPLLLAASLLRIPVIPGPDPGERPRPRSLRRFLDPLLLGRGTGNRGVTGRQSRSVPQGDGLRRRWAIPPEAFCILFAGPLQDAQRPLDLLEALALVVARRPPGSRPLHLLIAGSGPLEATCRQRAAALRLPLSFAGRLGQAERQAVFAACDCLVVTAEPGAGRSPLLREASEAGLPVLLAEPLQGQDDEKFQLEGFSALPFPVGDVSALADRLGRLAAELEATGAAAALHAAVLGLATPALRP